MKAAFAAAWLALALVCSAHASAHAFLDHASPRVGSTVQGSPPEVRLWVTQELAPGRYTVKWRALSVDTHVTGGDFSFEVQP